MKIHLGDLRLSSPAFNMDEQIPQSYADSQKPVSPPLAWTGVPEGTGQFALICHDPDAPFTYGFTHWVVYGIPATASSLAEGLPQNAYTPGSNGHGLAGYLAPAPPQGHGPHHYFFTLYALDASVQLEPGLTRKQLLAAIDEHILVQARLVGLYEN